MAEYGSAPGFKQVGYFPSLLVDTVKGFRFAIVRLMPSRDRSRFLIRRFSTTTIQTGKHSDRKSGIQIHRPFRQHCAAAFVASLHDGMLALPDMGAYTPEVLDRSGKSPHICQSLWAVWVLPHRYVSARYPVVPLTGSDLSHSIVVIQVMNHYV